MNGPITEKDIEDNNAQAEEDEFKLHQLEEDARMEAQWLARQESEDANFDSLDDSKPLGYILSKQDPYGVYTPDGHKIGSTCGCEDYPCCGH